MAKAKAKSKAVSKKKQVEAETETETVAEEAVPQQEEEEEEEYHKLQSYTIPQEILDEQNAIIEEEDVDVFAATSKAQQITTKESKYSQQRFQRGEGELVRDAFSTAAPGDDSADAVKGPQDEALSYGERQRFTDLQRENQELDSRLAALERAKLVKNQEAVTNGSGNGNGGDTPPRRNTNLIQDGEKTPPRAEVVERKKRRWDVGSEDPEASSSATTLDQDTQAALAAAAAPTEATSQSKKKRSRWDETPDETSSVQSATASAPAETSTAPAKRSRWDQTPVAGSAAAMALVPGTMPQNMPAIDPRFRMLSDADLDILLPTEGYTMVQPPPGYEPAISAAQRLAMTQQQAPLPEIGGFTMTDGTEAARAIQAAGGYAQEAVTDIDGIGAVQFLKPEDKIYFAKVLGGSEDPADLSMAELKERKIMRLLLKIKNGTPPVRKTALRQITDRAREFGAGPLFDKILPLLMERTLEDQERHLLVKVIDRVLYKLDDLVRPYVHKILVVIEPLLIDEDYYARVEGREIISNLSKAAGLAHMISTMRPDIDHADEYVRNTTARAFSVVASALGIPALLPFLKAVCRSKKSWQARHTGVRIIQQISIMMGCAVLPHLRALVECIAGNLKDEQPKVRTITALALAALAEAAAPYGIESFDSVIKPLWLGTRETRGKGLAAFLKAIGYIIPLMDVEFSSYYTDSVMPILIREFQSSDEEMKKIVLKVVKQCAGTEGVTAAYLKKSVLAEFFKNFWVRRMALDRRNYAQVVETTVSLAMKVGSTEIISRIVDGLKDESEPMRKMVMETTTKVVQELGAAEIGESLEIQLIDGIINAFQLQTVEDNVILDGCGAVVNALGQRVKPYLTQIVSAILWRLGNKSAKVRQQAADLTARLAVVIKACDEDQLLSKLGVVLFEQLGEEFPDALGSIIAAEAAIANVVGMTEMNPPVKDLLPRMTPILRNRHEKVQEASINLIGRIADRGAEHVPPREWMRICFELLDLLKAHKKAIRRAAVNSFGYIAKAIGPSDVLSVLLTNLRVQERQSRVCSTVAIAIVAETCGPFTCIPALLNEYRTPDINVRNGCLKAMSWMFEYIGQLARDYIYSVVGMIEDALTDRDQVHRQQACAIVGHLALGVVGYGKEDALIHLLNLVFPNIYETSPHVINNVLSAIEAMRLALGPGVIMTYILQGLHHPARKVREVYWRIYNTTYMGAADSLVPFYPRLDSLGEGKNDYRRPALDIFL